MRQKNQYLKDGEGKFRGSRPASKSPVISPAIKSPVARSPIGKPPTQEEPYSTIYAAYKKDKSPPPPSLPPGAHPKEIAELVHIIGEELSQIEFPNHSALHDGEWLSLDELKSSPNLMRNNCFAVTSAISQHIYEKIGLSDGWNNSEVELYFEHSKIRKNNGVHWANVIEYSQTKEKWVIDYTGQQFDENAPFPIVAKYEEWKKWVSSTIRNRHEQNLISETLY